MKINTSFKSEESCVFVWVSTVTGLICLLQENNVILLHLAQTETITVTWQDGEWTMEE